jgi:cytochrome c-type biogenesis protein CcmH/NrfG
MILLYLALFLALIINTIALRHHKLIMFLSSILIIIGSLGAYYFLGSSLAWEKYQDMLQDREKVSAILQDDNKKLSLIHKMEEILASKPEVEGMLILSRLYADDNSWVKSLSILKQAYALEPHNTKVVIYYVQAKYMLNQQVLDDESVKILQNLLQLQPKQQDALILLAQHALYLKDNKLAKGYWRQLLKTLPKNSQEYQEVLGLIKDY